MKIIFLLPIIIFALSLNIYSQTDIEEQLKKNVIELKKELQTNSDTLKAIAYHKIGLEYEHINPLKAIAYFDSSLSICNTENYTSLKVRNLNCKGISLVNLTIYDIALENYFEALTITNNDSLEQKSMLLNNIVQIYIFTENYIKADSVLQIAKKTSKNISSKNIKQTLLNNEAIILSVNEKNADALIILKELLPQLDSIDPLRIKVLLNTSILYRFLGEPEKSFEYLHKSYQIAKKIGVNSEILLIETNVAEQYFVNEQLDSAFYYYNIVKEKAEKTNENKILISCYKALSTYYNKKKKYKMAYEYSLKYIEIKDKTNIEGKKIAVEKAAIEFKLRQEYAATKSQNKMQKILLKNKINQIKILISVTIVVLVLLITVFLLFKKNKFAYNKLVEKNQVIIKTEHENKKLIKLVKKNVQEEIIVSNEDSEMIKKIKEIMDNEKLFLNKDFTLTQFANCLNTSTNKLSKLLNSSINKSFSDFVNEYRVKEVQQMIENVKYIKYSLEEIAEIAGFKTRNTFWRVFKKHTGVTPSHYRKNIYSYEK